MIFYDSAIRNRADYKAVLVPFRYINAQSLHGDSLEMNETQSYNFRTKTDGRTRPKVKFVCSKMINEKAKR
jgi:hypothetical protein